MKERRAKVFIFIGKILCSFVFFSSFNRAAVAFFVLWCVSASFETCWLDFWRRRCLLRNYFLVLYDYPRCNTCSLSEWLCSRRSRIVCDALLLYFFKSLFSLVHTTVAGNLSNVSFWLYHFAQGGTALFYGTQFRFMLASSFRKVHTTSVAAYKCQKLVAF